jgi:uncharacterized protein
MKTRLFYAMAVMVFALLTPAGLWAQETATTATSKDKTVATEFGELFKETLKKAEAGDAESQYELGKMCSEGSCFPKDSNKATDWFRQSAEQGYAKAQFHLGLIYLRNAADLETKSIIYEEEDVYREKIKKMKEEAPKWFSLAYPNIQQLAESGDAEAQFILSRMLAGMWVDKVAKDESMIWRKKAIESFERIAKSGNVEAQRSLGEIYSYFSDPTNDIEKIRWYTKAANQGDAIAQYRLGYHYRWLTKDYPKAIDWLKKAAQQGHVEAQFELMEFYFELGEKYDVGKGVAQDPNEAFKWYKKAAEQGYPKAQNLLGGIYHWGGMGGRVAQDYQEAIKWFRKAAEQGYPEAQCNLGDMYNKGDGVAQDYQEAIKWYKKAAEQDDASAQFNLALMYRKGDGVAKDSNEAIKWYKKAAEQGYMVAQYGLGMMYANGYDVAKNYQEAIKWFRKTAEWGLADAQYNLGLMYANGQGVPQDYIEAYKWLNLAAAQGNENAAKKRDILIEKMTPSQIAEAQRLSKEFKPKNQ